MPNIDKKIQDVQAIKEKLSRAKSLVVVNYLGTKVEEDAQLRKELREAGIEYKVIKNNLVRRACEGTAYESLVKDLVGANAFAFGYDDAVLSAKLLKGISKKFPKIEFVSGVVDGEYYDAKMLDKLADIPSRDELIAKFLGSIQSPISNFAYVLSAIADKKEE